MTSADRPELGPDEDSPEDYDLLTYGEVAARLSELLASESRRLAELTKSGADPAALRAVEQRIAMLETGKLRYEHQAETAEVFLRRFGLTPRRRGRSTS